MFRKILGRFLLWKSTALSPVIVRFIFSCFRLSEAELDAGLKELLAIFDKAGSYPKGRGADQDQIPGCIEKEYIKSKHSGLHTIRLKTQKP